MEHKHVLNRYILKLSGESLGPHPEGIGAHDPAKLAGIVSEIKLAFKECEGLQLGIVPGGGNMGRGSTLCRLIPGFDATRADYMGMINTLSNALFLEGGLALAGIECRLMSAFPISSVGEPYNFKVARSHLEKGRVVILAAGTGATGMTTDSAAIIRTKELNAKAMLKGTKVKGVYSSDPEKDPTAIFLPQLSYAEFGARNLSGILDRGAIIIASEKGLPIHIFSIFEAGNLARIIRGERLGTIIK